MACLAVSAHVSMQTPIARQYTAATVVATGLPFRVAQASSTCRLCQPTSLHDTLRRQHGESF